MGRKRQASKGKKIKPHFWVFCEGKTEEAYICYLRSKYRVPIEIVSKVAGDDINERYISNFKKGKPTHAKDIDFLLYDADVKVVLEKLRKIKSTTLLISNPSIELWFLLHYKNQTAHTNTSYCSQELSKRNRKDYKKGVIDDKLKEKLDSKNCEACKRAKKLSIPGNPSSNIYELIEILEKVIKTEE